MPIVFTDETAIIKLGISESNKTALEKHPYLNSRQLKALLSYKLQHGSITEQNFMQHPAIDPKHKNQLRHYLKFD
jgi:hypothetical protein